MSAEESIRLAAGALAEQRTPFPANLIPQRCVPEIGRCRLTWAVTIIVVIIRPRMGKKAGDL